MKVNKAIMRIQKKTVRDLV
uniref:Uncharacterized protein n=1 Tax=Anguilla anguilla TaxID=7936 RepID=A0A0E9RHQ1_ANGAN